MKFAHSFLLPLIAMPFSASAQQGEDDRQRITVFDVFNAENVEGTFVTNNLIGNDLIVYNVERSLTQLSPASTFKILNTLVALDAGIVNSKDSRFRWDGTKRDLAAWNKDQTLQSAFKVSCVWCYQEIAREVGAGRYQVALAETNYGNQQIGEQIDQFWLNGKLKISALEQVDFLARLLNDALPYPAEHVDILRSIMREDDSPDDYTIYAKTGWTGRELAVGWYVGYVEKDDVVRIFALNMRMDSADQAPLRKLLAIRSLRALGII